MAETWVVENKPRKERPIFVIFNGEQTISRQIKNFVQKKDTTAGFNNSAHSKLPSRTQKKHYSIWDTQGDLLESPLEIRT